MHHGGLRPRLHQPARQAMDNAILMHSDPSAGVIRTELHCRPCGGHLGHVLNDGPALTVLRYCIDGLAVTFRPT